MGFFSELLRGKVIGIPLCASERRLHRVRKADRVRRHKKTPRDQRGVLIF
jgi:hypothetical protein